MSDYPNKTKFSGLFVPRSLRPSSIHEILNKRNPTLEELLDNEEFSFELRNGNPRLMDYFTKNVDKVVQLIDYIITMPPDPTDKNRAYKYPFLACEIFERDIATIINVLFTGTVPKDRPDSEPSLPLTEPDQPEEGKTTDPYLPKANGRLSQVERPKSQGSQKGQTLMEYLFTFLNTDEELNPVLAGYFSKVVEAIFRKNPAKTIEFVYDRDILLKLANHIDSKSISELVALLICYEPFQYEEEKPNYLEAKLNVLTGLIDTLTKKEDIDNLTNASNTLCEIISRNEIIVDGKELADRMVSEASLNQIMGALAHKKNNTVILNICNVLLFIVEYLNPVRLTRNLTLTYKLQKQNRDLNSHPLITCLYENIHLFSNLLGDDSNSQNMQTVFGTSVRAVGLGKIRMIELIEKIVKLNNKRICARMQELGVIKTITELYVQSPWNNMLHQTYESLIVTILGKSDPTLLQSLFEDTQILQVVMDIVREADYELPHKGRKVRKGYFGHTVKLANDLKQFGETNGDVREYLSRNSEWENFISTVIQPINDANNTEIGGPHPKLMLKGDYTPKRGLTDELEGQGYPFGDQGTTEKSRIMQKNSRLPLETKVDELELPPSNPHSVQIERGSKFPAKNPYELDSYDSPSPIYNAGQGGMESPYARGIGPHTTSIDQDQYFQKNETMSVAEGESGDRSEELGDDIPLRHCKSTGEAAFDRRLTETFSERESIVQDESFANKKEKRKLTLVRKTFPNSVSHPVNPTQETRSSLDNSKTSKIVRIKIRKADTQDGMKVLEALNKYKTEVMSRNFAMMQSYASTPNSTSQT